MQPQGTAAHDCTYIFRNDDSEELADYEWITAIRGEIRHSSRAVGSLSACILHRIQHEGSFFECMDEISQEFHELQAFVFTYRDGSLRRSIKQSNQVFGEECDPYGTPDVLFIRSLDLFEVPWRSRMEVARMALLKLFDNIRCRCGLEGHARGVRLTRRRLQHPCSRLSHNLELAVMRETVCANMAASAFRRLGELHDESASDTFGQVHGVGFRRLGRTSYLGSCPFDPHHRCHLEAEVDLDATEVDVVDDDEDDDEDEEEEEDDDELDWLL